jgi:hypothetical protein
LADLLAVDKSKGDILAIVTTNEVAKVKLLDAEAPYVIPLNSSEGGGNIIEYIATFPNVTVNVGDGYQACVLLVNNLDLKQCRDGQNSPAARSEFVDISLNATAGTATAGTVIPEEETASPIEENGEEGEIATEEEEEEEEEADE